MPRNKEATIDLVLNGGDYYGEVAAKIAANGKMNVGLKRPYVKNDGLTYVTVFTGGNPKLKKNWKEVRVQANSTLRRDEWKRLDEAVMRVARYRLGGIEDLISNGLTYNLGNGMGTSVLEWHSISDPGEAILSMDGLTRGNNVRPNFKTNYLPIPIIHFDYEINGRELETSRNMGNPLDTDMAELAAQRCMEKLENLLFTDTTFSYGEKDDLNRNSIYSYLNFPDRNLVNLSIPWNESACTGAMMVQDVMECKQASLDARHYGPWMLYIPSGYETYIDEDYDASTPGTTIRERIMKIKGIKDIKVIDTLTANNVVLVEMNPMTVRLVRGLAPTNLQWGVEGDLLYKYKVMQIQVPQIRSDQEGHCGIVHLS
jgi:hypothetical protein